MARSISAQKETEASSTHAKEDSTDHDDLEDRTSEPVNGVGDNFLVLRIFELGNGDSHGCWVANRWSNLCLDILSIQAWRA
jgi:hypothetical protein